MILVVLAKETETEILQCMPSGLKVVIVDGPCHPIRPLQDEPGYTGREARL